MVGEPVAVDVFQFEDGAVAGLDDHGRERELGESLQLEGEGSIGQGGGEVVEALALDRCEQPAVRGVDGVIAGGDGRSDGVRTLRDEPVWVALAGVDGDRDRLVEAAPARDSAAGVRCSGGLLCLPKDRGPPLDLGEDKL